MKDKELEYKKLEKALDLACKKLAVLGDEFEVCPPVSDCERYCKDCWKKFYLKAAENGR